MLLPTTQKMCVVGIWGVVLWCLQQLASVFLCLLWQIVFQVLYLHILLGLQNLLCVWFYDAGSGHPLHRDSLRHHRLHVLPAQRWGLQMVSVSAEHHWFDSLSVKGLINWMCSLLGNGQVSSLLRRLLFMFTCTRFTTTSLKPSKFLAYLNLCCTVGIYYCMSHVFHTLGLKMFPN